MVLRTSALFPSPLEVYRFISELSIEINIFFIKFPSPLEVYRFISQFPKRNCRNYLFPSPLEVYRFISELGQLVANKFNGFRPLSRYIGLYLSKWQSGEDLTGGFRPLSRYIGLYQTMMKFLILQHLVSVPSRGI